MYSLRLAFSLCLLFHSFVRLLSGIVLFCFVFAVVVVVVVAAFVFPVLIRVCFYFKQSSQILVMTCPVL